MGETPWKFKSSRPHHLRSLLKRRMFMRVLIVIPARMASVRLPGKMMADIGGKPLIVRTYESVISAKIGDVIVACDSEEIKSAIENVGGKTVMTDPDLQSGTDRVCSAWKQYGSDYDCVMNVQGDMPFVDSKLIIEGYNLVRSSEYDISTLCTKICDDSYNLDSVVKPVISFTSENEGRALYFSRSVVPHNSEIFYHHVGIYCFRSEALTKFVNLPQSYLEKTEKLEQLRALENDMSIGIKVVDAKTPISVDTPHDLDRARKYYASLK